MPAHSYPRPAGNIGDSTYWSLRHIDSGRLIPIAFTSIRTSCRPGAGTCASMNSRTSGPPACANLIARDMAAPLKSGSVGFGTSTNGDVRSAGFEGVSRGVRKLADLIDSGQEAHEPIAGA